jgi:hypothetical protein
MSPPERFPALSVETPVVMSKNLLLALCFAVTLSQHPMIAARASQTEAQSSWSVVATIRNEGYSGLWNILDAGLGHYGRASDSRLAWHAEVHIAGAGFPVARQSG